MTEIEFLEWSTQWKQQKAEMFKEHVDVVASHRLTNIDGLNQFVQHGEIKLGNLPSPRREAGQSRWETYLNAFLSNYALYRAREFEQLSEERGRLEVSMAKDIFSAILMSQVIDIFINWKFSSRFNGRELNSLRMDRFAFTAFGMVTCCSDQATWLARMQLLAYRKGFYKSPDKHPTIHFMMQIFAEFLGEPRHVPAIGEIKYPALDELSNHWMTPDSGKIADLCLQALSVRMICNEDSILGPEEFDHVWWIIPIEILLVLKLRQLKGLENPEIHHPLMVAPLGVLSDEAATSSDPLIDEVAARLKADGFDMDTIYKEFYDSQRN